MRVPRPNPGRRPAPKALKPRRSSSSDASASDAFLKERYDAWIDRLLPFPQLHGIAPLEVQRFLQRAMQMGRGDFEAYRGGAPACGGDCRKVRSISGVHAVADYRLASQFYQTKRPALQQVAVELWQASKRETQIDIHPGAQIGERLVIDHGCLTVIGETVVAGCDLTLLQDVTLGASAIGTNQPGPRHPIIGDNVEIAGGARILGPVRIGNNVRIGPDITIREDVPSNCRVRGANETVMILDEDLGVDLEDRTEFHAVTRCPAEATHLLVWGLNFEGAEFALVSLGTAEPWNAVACTVIGEEEDMTEVRLKRHGDLPDGLYGLEIRTLRGVRVIVSGSRALKRVIEELR